ncbi:MAG TPA: GH92 family glycosyl hydrolase [Puia sp.]
MRAFVCTIWLLFAGSVLCAQSRGVAHSPAAAKSPGDEQSRGIAQSRAVVNARGANLVTNPGFEDGQRPWQLDNWMKNEVIGERDPKNPHSGNWSMKVELTKVINGPQVSLAFPHLPLRGSTAVRLHFWARGVSNGANLTVMIRREVEPRITWLRTEMNLTDEWQEHTYTIQLPRDVIPFTPSLRFVLNQPGVFWVDDVSVTELPPTDNGPAPLINPIRNASFEAGRDGWTATFRKREFGTASQESGNGIPAPDDAGLSIATDSTDESVSAKPAPAGRRYLRMKIDPGCRAVLTSAYFPARYGHKGHLSFFLRCDGTHPFEAGLGSGINSSSAVQVQSAVTQLRWQQFSLPVTLKPAQDGLYFVCLRLNSPGVYDIDGVSFVEDDHANVPLYPAAAAIQPESNGPVANLYKRNDSATFNLVITGDQPNFTHTYTVSVLNYLERPIAKTTVNVAGDANGYGASKIKAPTALYGAFRIEARRTSSPDLLAEQIYSVLPPLPPPGERPDSYFGGHVDLTPYNLEIARKGGFRWLRMWPPLLTTWIAGEPQPGQWHFPTEAVANAYRQGFHLSGILGTAPDFAADIDPKSPIGNRWSHSYPPAHIEEWKEYVSRCTQALSPYITTWEVWNEPDGGYLQVRPGQKKVDVYIALLKAARETLDSIGKPVTLIGPAVASINAPLGREVLQHGGGRWLDAFSFHFYSLATGGANPDDAFVLPILAKMRSYKNISGQPMPLWHTEGGMYLQGGQSWLSTYRIPVSSPAKKPAAAASMVRAALFFKAMGVKHYFDFQLSATAAGSEINGDMTSGFIEATGIPGPGIAAHAAMVAITEDAGPVGFESLDRQNAKIKIAHFKKKDETIDVYWSDKTVSLKQLIKGGPPDEILDLMGNPVSLETAQTGEYPLYVVHRVSGSGSGGGTGSAIGGVSGVVGGVVGGVVPDATRSVAPAQKVKQPVDYVNNFIGVLDGHDASNCVIGPQLPFGSVSPSPQTPNGGNDGYSPDDPIRGFGQLHVSGTGWGTNGQVFISPQIGIATGEKDHDSPKTDESATPYEYAVTLQRYRIRTQLTPARHSVIYQFSFPRSDSANILLDITHNLPMDIRPVIGGVVSAGSVTTDEQGHITGYGVYRGGFGGGTYTVYFAAEVSKRPVHTATWLNGVVSARTSEYLRAKNDRVGAILNFSTKAGETIWLKIAVSYKSIDQAKVWLAAEIKDFDYDAVRARARSEWNTLLKKIEVEGGTEKDKTIFYTALYHAHLMPCDRTDDETDFGRGVPVWDDHFAVWDTWRTVYPLHLLLTPRMVSGTVNSFIARFSKYGLVRDAFVNGSDMNNEQGGNNIDNIIADAYNKGIKGVDWQAAYKILKYDADSQRLGSYAWRKEDSAGNTYKKKGWIPAGIMSCSMTLEYAYNDFCTALVARGLGKLDDYRRYFDRSHQWVNLWNKDAVSDGFRGFITPRKPGGEFVDTDLKKYPGSWKNYFYEGSSWTYSWFMPHDFPRLVELNGGSAAFVRKLDYGFSNNLIDYGNEPAFLAVQEFHYAGRPDRSSYWVRKLMRDRFTEKGVPGNDDSGAMSAWYIFSAMGFFPNAGQNIYYLTGPLFSKVLLHLGNGHTLRIEAPSASEKNIYVRGVSINGKKITGSIIGYKDIEKGGVITFDMSETPF